MFAGTRTYGQTGAHGKDGKEQTDGGALASSYPFARLPLDDEDADFDRENSELCDCQ